MGGKQSFCYKTIHKYCPQNSLESRLTIETVQQFQQSDVQLKQTSMHTKMNTESKSDIHLKWGSKQSISENINNKEEKSVTENHQVNPTCVRIKKNRFLEDKELEIRFTQHQIQKEFEFKQKQKCVSEENSELLSCGANFNNSELNFFNQKNFQTYSQLQLKITHKLSKFGKQFKSMSTEKDKKGILRSRHFKSLGPQFNSKGSSVESVSETSKRKVTFDSKTNFAYDRDHRVSNWGY